MHARIRHLRRNPRRRTRKRPWRTIQDFCPAVPDQVLHELPWRDETQVGLEPCVVLRCCQGDPEPEALGQGEGEPRGDVDAARRRAAAVEAGARGGDAVDRVAMNQADCGRTVDPGRVTIRRLNRVEYNNTIRDLVGRRLPARRRLPLRRRRLRVRQHRRRADDAADPDGEVSRGRRIDRRARDHGRDIRPGTDQDLGGGEARRPQWGEARRRCPDPRLQGRDLRHARRPTGRDVRRPGPGVRTAGGAGAGPHGPAHRRQAAQDLRRDGRRGGSRHLRSQRAPRQGQSPDRGGFLNDYLQSR